MAYTLSFPNVNLKNALLLIKVKHPLVEERRKISLFSTRF